MTIRVHVTGRGALQSVVPAGHTVELADDATVDALLPALGATARPSIFVVNGIAVSRGASLSDSDRVEIHPQVAGG